MTGVTTCHPEEPYANSARTVLWEVRGASRAPTRVTDMVRRSEVSAERRKS